jgi:hypothetical protein
MLAARKRFEKVSAPTKSLQGWYRPRRMEVYDASRIMAGRMPFQKPLMPSAAATTRTVDNMPVPALEIWIRVLIMSIGWITVTVSTAALPAVPRRVSSMR